MTILLIDNTQSIVPLLQLLEKHSDEPLVHCTSGKQAIDHLSSGTQDEPLSLVCMSTSLKDIHGYALCSYLKHHPLCVHTPLIVLGGDDQRIGLEQLEELGICDFFMPPFTASDLRFRVKMALKLSRESRQRLFCERKLASLGHSGTEDTAQTLLHPLSSLPNRTALQYYVRQFNHRNAVPLSFIALAVDSYEAYLHTYRHERTHILCRDLAQVIAAIPAPLGSVLCQYDAHIFVVMLPSTPIDDAVKLANSLRKTVHDLGFEHRESRCADIVTLSAGIGRTENTAYTPVNALATAFLNMERAMRAGGNHALASTGMA